MAPGTTRQRTPLPDLYPPIEFPKPRRVKQKGRRRRAAKDIETSLLQMRNTSAGRSRVPESAARSGFLRRRTALRHCFAAWHHLMKVGSPPFERVE